MIIYKIKKENFVWDDSIFKSYFSDTLLEYIDPREQNTCLIAVKRRDLINRKR